MDSRHFSSSPILVDKRARRYFHHSNANPYQPMKALILVSGLSVVCFAAFSQQLATNAVATPKAKRQPVWFQKYDLNRNGTLDPDERKALQTHAQDQRTAFILSMDKNGDGKIDTREQWLAKSNKLAASSTTTSTNIIK